MKDFLAKPEQTGRQIVIFPSGKKYYIEAIGNPHTNFGDVNPSTKKVEGSYGNKYRGSIDKEESMITTENGFNKIYELQAGESPYSFIEKLEKNGRK